MFLRRKKNRSGTTSIVVSVKAGGKNKEIKTIGVSRDEAELEQLYKEGKIWIDNHVNGEDLFRQYTQDFEEERLTSLLLSNIENILHNGTQLILNRVYDAIGYSSIDDYILRQLVISRLSQPMSKSATVEYLKAHFDEDVHLDKIYRYMDKLYSTQQECIHKISIEHTKKILGGKIGLMFYDVTTLYFEADYGDGFREPGFSKDGKHSQPQIVLGLLVSEGGYPLSYSMFNGTQYEGHTMIPIVDDFVQRFKLDDFVVVADSGLMNKKNIDFLKAQGYSYIIGARIKSASKTLRDWLLSREKIVGSFEETKVDNGRLIVGYSEKRAKKDAHNRLKGINRLENAFKAGTITKENINKRGYNKFLVISKDVRVTIDKSKVEEDAKWDGLKGYITNTDLSAAEVYNQYNSLWQIERAFRITKGTIAMRPMFHFTPKRIEAHVCICFIAYKVYKELERVLKKNKYTISVDKVLEIAKTVTTLKIKLPLSGKTMYKTMIISEKQKLIQTLFNDDFWKSQFG
jgi:transposase